MCVWCFNTINPSLCSAFCVVRLTIWGLIDKIINLLLSHVLVILYQTLSSQMSFADLQPSHKSGHASSMPHSGCVCVFSSHLLSLYLPATQYLLTSALLAVALSNRDTFSVVTASYLRKQRVCKIREQMYPLPTPEEGAQGEAQKPDKWSGPGEITQRYKTGRGTRDKWEVIGCARTKRQRWEECWCTRFQIRRLRPTACHYYSVNTHREWSCVWSSAWLSDERWY